MDIGANRGLSNSVQVVVLLPMLIGLFLLLLQWSLQCSLEARLTSICVVSRMSASMSDQMVSRFRPLET